MLTSYHYLLGGLITVSCATGTLAHSVATLQISPVPEPGQSELIQVSDRGSGRLSDSPAGAPDADEEKGPLADRGSGRFRPYSL